MESIANWLLRWRYLSTVVLLVITAWLVTALDTFGFDADFRIFFDHDDPMLLDYETLEREFTQSYTLLLVVEAKQGDLFTRQRLDALQSLSDASWRLPHVSRVLSIANHQHTSAEGDELWVEDLLDQPSDYDDSELARARSIALSEPELVGRLISSDGRIATVIAYLDLDAEHQAEKPQVMQAARDMVAEFEQRHDDLRIRYSGQLASDVVITEIAERDAAQVEMKMFIVLLLLLGILFRSLVAVLGALLVMAGSVAAATGFLGMVYQDFNGINLSTPYIVCMMAILDCVHIIAAYFSRLSEGLDKLSAMRASLSKNFEALLITSLTTAVGFLGMNFASSPPFREFGTATAFGVMLAFLFSITLLPAVLLLFPAKRVRVAPASGLVARAQNSFAKHSRWYLPIGWVVIAIMVPAALLNQPNNHTLDAFKKDQPVRVTAELLEREMAGIDTIDFMLDSGTANGIATPTFLNTVDQFVEWLQQQPEVIKVSGFHTVIKRLNKSMHGDDDSYYRIPDQRRAIAEYLLVYESSVPEELDLQDTLNTDKSAIKITAMSKILSSVDMLALQQRASEHLATLDATFPKVVTSSPSLMMAYIAQSNIISMLGGCLFVAVFVWLSLVFAFRSVRLGSLCMIPNLIPAIVAFGLCGLLIQEIDMGTAMIFSMTLGVVVDDTVHFVVSYRRLRQQGHDKHAAVHHSYGLVGRAIMITTLVLCIGFMIPVLFAELQVNIQMYALSIVCFATALIADLFFLPALLVKTDREPQSH